jgi:hypothetical protein
VAVIFSRDGHNATLRVSDAGIGMSANTIANFFLSAGASLGSPPPDKPDEGVAWLKAGRFGIGVLACFLLENKEVSVATRRPGVARGLRFTARLDSNLVEMRYADDVSAGTEVTVSFDLRKLASRLKGDYSEMLGHLARSTALWYRLSDPPVSMFVEDGSRSGEIVLPRDVPDPIADSDPAWHSVDVADYDKVLWSHQPAGFEDNEGSVVHNGIAIEAREGNAAGPARYRWSRFGKGVVERPRLAIFDSRHRFGLTLNRFALERGDLTFEEKLQQAIGEDVAALALTAGPGERHPLIAAAPATPVYGETDWHPLFPSLVSAYAEHLLVLWQPSPSDRDADTDPFAASARAFSDGIGPIPWTAGTRRAVLAVEDAPDRWSDVHQLHAILAHIDDAAEDICTNLGLSSAISAFVYLGARELGPVVPGWQSEWLDPHGWLWHTPARGDGGETAKTLLAEAGLALARHEGAADAVGLTLFYPEAPEPRRDAQLARPWLEAVAGPIPREEVERLRRASQIARRDPGMKKALEKRMWTL